MKGKEASLSVTVDIEDWYHIPSVTGSPFSSYLTVNEFFDKWDDRYDYLTEPTGRVLNLLDNYRIYATFFVVADVVEHYPGLVESIADRGHEIACHGLHHECKIDPKTKGARFTKEEFEKRTKEAKKILEKVSGQKVVGYRAPNALIGGWMIDSLEEIGFRYDSSVSVNSIYNKTDSQLKDVSTNPYYPQFQGLEPSSETRNIIEIPWAYYNIGFKVPAGGGPVLRFIGARIIKKGLIQSLNRGHTVFYFHPIDISNEKFPKIGNKRLFYWIIKGKSVEEKIRYLLEQINLVSCICLRDYDR